MIRILFEEPFWLALILAPLLFVLWGLWNRSRSTAAGRMLLAGLVATAALFAIQRLVVTDRERLQHTTRVLSEAVAAGDLDAMLALIHPDATVRGVGPPKNLRSTVANLLQRYTVEDPEVYAFTITFAKTHATLKCQARCTVRTAHMNRPVGSRWQLEFQLIDGRWWIDDLFPLEIGLQKYKSIRDIPLLAPDF